jgi:putative oxidoreductase
MSRLRELTFALFRIVTAFLYACHGAQKMFGAFGGQEMHHGILFWAAWIEIIAGPLIGIGLFTRVAAFIASGEMATAYFKMHAPHSFWPIVNHGELPVAFCFAFFFIFFNGAGDYSLDRLIRRKKINH